MLPPPIQSHASGTPGGLDADDRQDSPTIVVAPSAFKGTLTGPAAAEAMAAGVRDALPAATCLVLPMADGGDGSLDALEPAGFRRVATPTRGPTGELVASSLAIRGPVAVVELAAACGLALLPNGVLEPLGSSTAGLGDAIRAAVSAGASEVVVCLGGSASTDGGAGMLAALGARLLAGDGSPVLACGGTLADVAQLDLSGLDPRLAAVQFTVATDVTSPLLGPTGAAAVFAPQKGATGEQVALLEAGLGSWADVLAGTTLVDARNLPGAGAAGGTAAALIAALGGTITSGARYIADAVGLGGALDSADVVITGEGRFDAQSLLGKVVGVVAAEAAERDVPVIAVCGSVALTAQERVLSRIAMIVALDETPVPGLDVMSDAAELVRIATRGALRTWART